MYIVEIQTFGILDVSIPYRARNLAKVAAARSYTHARGWGFVMTSGRRSLRLLESHVVDADLACQVRHLVDRPEGCLWRDIRELRNTTALSTIDLCSLIVANGWVLNMDPYVIQPREVARHADTDETRVRAAEAVR